LRAMPGRKFGCRSGVWVLSARLFVFAGIGGSLVWSQTSSVSQSPASAAPEAHPALAAGADSLAQWAGLQVKRVSIEGVSSARLGPLNGNLAQALGAPLKAADLQKSLRQLYATGLFDNVQVDGSREGDGVALVFLGTPRSFIGTVSVDGAKGATVNTQLERASRLVAGTRFTQARLTRALTLMRQTLAENGFHQPEITQQLTPNPDEQLIDIVFHVVSGSQARVGTVDVTGDSGMSPEEFRRATHLKSGAHVDHDTGNRALAGVMKHYQNQQRLEADVKLESQKYAAETKTSNFSFSANRGPIVKVLVEGASLSEQRVRRIIPVYEEGTVDEDLLNEGNRRLRDYYQRLGYFDVKVDHEQQSPGADQVVILYKVRLGASRRVEHVSVAGNRFFNAKTLEDLLSVHAANTLDRHGSYSQALVSADVSALEAMYRNNGFSRVKVTPDVDETGAATPGAKAQPVAAGKAAPMTVVYRIEEGEQQRVASVRIEGAEQTPAEKLTPLLNTTAGQLFSPQNLAGDRDALLTDYLSRGFLEVKVDVTPQEETADPGKVDVVFHVTEGPQIFVRKVLITGLHYTRPDTIARAIAVHAGDPLNETALADTQRNLYEFALFNEIDTAIENPDGGETQRTVLLQATEARRWALTYGLGFEAQTGTPQVNCRGLETSGASCNPEGKTGISPRVLADITRNALFGREQSASLRAPTACWNRRSTSCFRIRTFTTTATSALLRRADMPTVRM
jgi:outer membrane protein insertion porin family